MATFTSDDELGTYSTIMIPTGTPLRCQTDADGRTVSLAFGVHDRVVLDLDPDMVDPLLHALVRTRRTQQANAERAHAEAEQTLAAHLALHPLG